ncbi:MAG: asparagine synthase (glutamine-hydrolyzing) [Thermodesulfobacteriota bacterium]|nr:asparagine synthase (glutamine-hydrolyzing) [Thermodesulfobacteriota bacterium]
MCGISGFNWRDEDLIRTMNIVNKHRGPDDEGVYSDSRVTLGHVRLSIIDLSEKGRQPMANEDGTLWIVYNGEIYNFREIKRELIDKGHIFSSLTDTEVVLHAYEEYGLECLDRFNGMWAFALYDLHQNIFILCRDRFGIKPLYYHADGSKFIFSSMIAGILCHDISTGPNEQAIMEFLAYNLEDHCASTFFRNIYQLEPGRLLNYDLKSGKYYVEQWYWPKTRDILDEETIHDVFVDSVRVRTIADVPVGSCLSGGVDSSSIVSTLDRFLDYPFYTFSFVAPGSPIDETRYIKEVGRQAKVEQFSTQITEDDFLDEFEDFVKALEEPVLSLSPYAQYRVMKLAHEHGAKVLLDGQGGDELFAGYIYYFSYRYYELFKNIQWVKLIREAIHYVYRFKNLFPIAMFAFTMLPESTKIFTWKKILNKWINYDLLRGLDGEEFDPRWKRMSLDEALRLTLFSTAIPHLLRWEDKNAMRWGIESRVPFLDVNVVETALALPAEAKLKNGETKVVFKKAVHKILPEMIRNRTDKIGFETPIDDFFRKPSIVSFCKDIIYSDEFKARPYWKWERVEKMFQAHIEKKADWGKEIWKWINLEVWLEKYFSRNIV